MTVCTMPECQTTAGCKCWPQRRLTKIECRSPCWECPEYHDLQRWRENDWADSEKRERELLRKIEALIIDRERQRFDLDGLRERVKHLGDIADVCTFDVTKEICAHCKCSKTPDPSEFF